MCRIIELIAQRENLSFLTYAEHGVHHISYHQFSDAFTRRQLQRTKRNEPCQREIFRNDEKHFSHFLCPINVWGALVWVLFMLFSLVGHRREKNGWQKKRTHRPNVGHLLITKYDHFFFFLVRRFGYRPGLSHSGRRFFYCCCNLLGILVSVDVVKITCAQCEQRKWKIFLYICCKV